MASAVQKPMPAVATGIASMPAPRAVPATMKVLPIALFFTRVFRIGGCRRIREAA